MSHVIIFKAQWRNGALSFDSIAIYQTCTLEVKQNFTFMIWYGHPLCTFSLFTYPLISLGWIPRKQFTKIKQYVLSYADIQKREENQIALSEDSTISFYQPVYKNTSIERVALIYLCYHV